MPKRLAVSSHILPATVHAPDRFPSGLLDLRCSPFLSRPLCFFFCKVVPDRATSNRADNRVMSSDVARQSADRGSLEAACRLDLTNTEAKDQSGSGRNECFRHNIFPVGG